MSNKENITKKALLVTTVSGFVPQFEMQNVRILQNMGYEIHYAANYTTPAYGYDNQRLNNTGIIQHQIDFERKPFKFKNIKAFFQLYHLMKIEKYSLIHCHTPMGGVLARITARINRVAPIIYTAHGFHFYKGAPIKNWLFYYAAEKILSYFTDILITINQEDYFLAKKKFHARQMEYLPGVGINISKFSDTHINKSEKRIALGVLPTDIMLLSVGELIPRKNHELVIKAIKNINNYNIQYFICGKGAKEAYLSGLIQKLNLEKNVHLIGYREDIGELCQASDLFVFPSLQEGLSVALMEAIAAKTPVICSNIRGNTDLIKNPDSLFNPHSEESLCKCLRHALERKMDGEVQTNYRRLKRFDEKNIIKSMKSIYDKALILPISATDQ